MSSTEIVTAQRDLLKATQKLMLNSLTNWFTFFISCEHREANASRCNANVVCQQSVSNLSTCRYCTENLSAQIWNECELVNEHFQH